MIERSMCDLLKNQKSSETIMKRLDFLERPRTLRDERQFEMFNAVHNERSEAFSKSRPRFKNVFDYGYLSL